MYGDPEHTVTQKGIKRYFVLFTMLINPAYAAIPMLGHLRIRNILVTTNENTPKHRS